MRKASASAMVGRIGLATAWERARGPAPKPRSRGGKRQLGGISKQGDGAIRRLIVVGATAMIHSARRDNPGKTWAKQPLERKSERLPSFVPAGEKRSPKRLSCLGFCLLPRDIAAAALQQGVEKWYRTGSHRALRFHNTSHAATPACSPPKRARPAACRRPARHPRCRLRCRPATRLSDVLGHQIDRSGGAARVARL